MQVILRQDVDKLGLRGDVVDVARGYARNFLLPRKLAETATPAKVAEVRKHEEKRAKQEAQSVEQAQEIVARLEADELRFDAPAGETGTLFGSVTATNIVEEVWSSKKTRIDRRKIDLAEPIKRIGRYEIPVDALRRGDGDAAGRGRPRRRRAAAAGGARRDRRGRGRGGGSRAGRGRGRARAGGGRDRGRRRRGGGAEAEAEAEDGAEAAAEDESESSASSSETDRKALACDADHRSPCRLGRRGRLNKSAQPSPQAPRALWNSSRTFRSERANRPQASSGGQWEHAFPYACKTRVTRHDRPCRKSGRPDLPRPLRAWFGNADGPTRPGLADRPGSAAESRG